MTHDQFIALPREQKDRLLWELIKNRKHMLVAVNNLIDMIDVPEPNCSCHICPPCSDCVEYGGLRDVIETARGAIAAAREQAEGGR